jgi:hypothetical protein
MDVGCMGWFDFPADARWNIRIIGIYTILFAVFLVAVGILTYFSGYPNLFKLVIYVTCSGGLGGLAFSIYGFTNHLGDNTFKLNYTWWYILRPFIGILYGTFSFFFLAGGLMTLSGISSQEVSTSLYNIKTEMFYCGVSFIAGFAERAFSRQLNELADAIFEKAPPATPPGGT